VAEGDGLPIRAQRLTGPNPAQILRHLAQAERVEELGAVQLAWAATGRRRAGRRYSPQFAAPHPAHDVCGGAARPIIRTSLSICCYLVHAPRIT
jgi:hypothetical protein